MLCSGKLIVDLYWLIRATPNRCREADERGLAMILRAILDPYRTHTKPIPNPYGVGVLGHLIDNKSENGVLAGFGH